VNFISNFKFKIEDNQNRIKTRILDINDVRQQGIVFYDEPEDEINKVLEIKIDESVIVNLYINGQSYGENDLAIKFLVSKEKILLAGKKRSCRINLSDGFIDNTFEHFLFWDFVLLDNGLILEQGEVDCLLRDQDGVIIDYAPVDPPYEVYYEEEGIKFESIVYGTTRLKYPKDHREGNSKK